MGRRTAERTEQEWEASARAGAAGLTPEELIDAVSKLDTLCEPDRKKQKTEDYQ